MPAPNAPWLSRMHAARAELLALVEDLDEAALGWPSPDGGWSARDTLAHLVDAERSHRRFVQAVLAGQPVHLPNFDLDRWNQEHVARRAAQSVPEILRALREERQATLDLLSTLSDAAWDSRGRHPALGDVTVAQVIRIIGVHERQHTREIRRLLEAHGVTRP
jgi:uncharacterized damage-inducible protein DinB